MDEITVLGGSLTRLIAIVGGSVSGVCIAYAGLMWMMSQGDPQNASKARMGLFGSIIGLIIVGSAFIIPRIVSQTVIEPVGGTAVQMDSGHDCDGLLRSQLVFQRGASTADRMDQVRAQIQSQRQECASEVWNPDITDLGTAGTTVCFADNDGSAEKSKVGTQLVPAGLRDGNVITGKVRVKSGRDSDNNIIVYWSTEAARPTDNAKCWLYVSRLATWSENY